MKNISINYIIYKDNKFLDLYFTIKNIVDFEIVEDLQIYLQEEIRPHRPFVPGVCQNSEQ
jgi:hypothetical protein